ncbi:MAG: hypothetical protein O2926_00760, partial [Actinomycetota bacterium]|nr:hypothetical protein [Actinomycetota bacterium]
KVVITGLVITTSAFVMFTLLTPDTATWQMLVIFFLLGYGLGNTIAPATTQMTMSIPITRSGAGSAVQNTVRQVGAALGVAIVSTIVATMYSNRMNSGLIANAIELPKAVKAQATDSIGGTFSVAEALLATEAISDDVVIKLQAIAIDAYMDSFHAAVLIGAAVVLLALIIMIWQMPVTDSTTQRQLPVKKQPDPTADSNDL